MTAPKYVGSDQWERDQAERRRAEANVAAVEAIRKIHSERHFYRAGTDWSECAEDRQAWPCATERAIRVALGEEEHS